MTKMCSSISIKPYSYCAVKKFGKFNELTITIRPNIIVIPRLLDSYVATHKLCNKNKISQISHACISNRWLLYMQHKPYFLQK